MRLFDYPRSSAAYRVRITCNLKNLKPSIVPIDLLAGKQRSASYSKLNPLKLVPTIVDETGLSLSQSLSIIWYLDQIAPVPRLFSEDARSKAREIEMALLIACDIHPLNNLRVLKYLELELNVDATARAKWYSHWIVSGFAALESMVTKYGDGSFCVGQQLSIADICLVPQMYNARRYGVDMGQFPTLVAIDGSLRQLDAFKRAAP